MTGVTTRLRMMCTALSVRAAPYMIGQLDKSHADVMHAMLQLIYGMRLSQQKATKPRTKKSRSILASQSSCKTYH